MSKNLQKLFYIFHRCSPAGAEADDGVAFVIFFHIAVDNASVELLHLLIGDDHKLLVGRGIQVEPVSLFQKTLADPHGGIHRISSISQIQVIRKKSVEHQACGKSLGQKCSVLFDAGHEVGRLIVLCKNDSFAEKGAAFGSADIEDIRQLRDILQVNVRTLRRKAGSQAGTIQKEWDIMSRSDMVKPCQLLPGVQGTVLCGVRDVDHPREDHMLMVGVLIKVCQKLLQLVRVDLAVVRRQSQHFMTGIFDGAGFMHVHMPACGGDHTLVWCAHRIDHHLVRLCTPDEKCDCGVRAPAGVADLFLRASGVEICSVTLMMFQSSSFERCNNLRAGTLLIVTSKPKLLTHDIRLSIAYRHFSATFRHYPPDFCIAASSYHTTFYCKTEIRLI